MALELITDRTQTDYDHANYLNTRDVREMTPKEVTELLSGELKGSYDYTDRNRVEVAVNYLVGLLNVNGYHIDISVIKTNWTENDVFRYPDMERYLNNIKAIKHAFYGTVGLPENMRSIDYEVANQIERLLLEIEMHINRLYLSAWVCGEAMCGEGTTL